MIVFFKQYIIIIVLMMEQAQINQDFHEISIKDIYTVEGSKTKSNYYFENKIIKNPQKVLQFFKQFENYTAQSKIQFIYHLNSSLEQISVNSKVLSETFDEQSKNISLIQYIITKYFSESKNPKISSYLLSTINLILKHNPLELKLLSKIIERVVVDFYESVVDYQNLLASIRVFSSIYENKIVLNTQPKNMLVFSSSQDLIIQSKKNISWPFLKGYTFSLWIYLQPVKSNNEIGLGKLFTFYAENSGGFQSYFIDDKLYYRILGSNYTEPQIGSNGIFLATIQTKKWHYLSIQQQEVKTFSRSKLNIFLDKKIVNSVSLDPPKPSSNAHTKIKFFEKMYCKTSAFCLYFNQIGGKSEEYSKNINSIDYIKDSKALIFQQRNQKIYQRSGFGWSDCKVIHKNRRMDCTHILPFFYLLKFLQTNTQESLLNELLNIIILYLRSSNQNQQQAEKHHFFKIIGTLMNEITIDLLNQNTIKVLLHIKHMITDQKLLDQFFSDFLWKLMQIKTDISRKIQIFSVIKSCFTQNLAHFSALLGLDQILNYMITFQARKIQCCQKHKRAFGQNQDKNQFAESKQQILLNNLLQIVQMLFSNPKIDLNLQIFKVLRLLTLKFSPCFQLSLLSIIKKILNDKLSQKLSQEQGKKTFKNLVEKKAYLIFLYNIANSPFIDVKAESLKAIFYLVSHKISSNISQLQLSTYISQILWNINQVRKQQSPRKIIENPIQIVPTINAPVNKKIKGFKDLTLNTQIKPLIINSSSDINEEPDQDIKKQKEKQKEAPQAPSMSNRRKPNLKFSFENTNSIQQQSTKQVIMQEQKTMEVYQKIKPPPPINKKKKTFSLNIDTQQINKLYSYGGQKGKQIIIDQQQQNAEIQKIRILAKKCVRSMNSQIKNSSSFEELTITPQKELLSVKENKKKIIIPIQPLNSTRNKDYLQKKNKGFSRQPELKIIEQSQKTDKSASEKKQSKPRSQRSLELSSGRRTPKISPSTKKQNNENMILLYSAILECIFQKGVQKIIAPAPKVNSLNCFQMLLNWGKYCSNQIKQLILCDLNIILQNESNLYLLCNNQQFLKFILDSVYTALISQSFEILKLSTELIKTLFQTLFFNDIEFNKKLLVIFNWMKEKEKIFVNTLESRIICFTVRYTWLSIIQSIQQYYQLKNSNDTLRENNFNALLYLTQQIICSYQNNYFQRLEIRDDGLSYLNNTNDIPNIIRSFFKYDWIDFSLADRILLLFNKFFSSKIYLNLKKYGNKERFIENSLESKANSEIYRQSEYYLNIHHNRGILLSISTIYSLFVIYNASNNFECEEEANQLISLGKLILILGQLINQKNILNKKAQIIETFMFVMKTVYIYSKEKGIDLLIFLNNTRNYLNSKIQNANEKDYTHLNLVTLEIITNYFSSINLSDINFLDEQQMKSYFNNLNLQLPSKIEQKQHSFSGTANLIEEIKTKYETEVYEYITNTIEAEKQRQINTNILLQLVNRQSKKQFRRIWKRLRTYNSLWRHPNFYFQNDNLYSKLNYSYEKLKENKIFQCRINKHQSKSKARFLLSTRLKEPEIVLKLSNKQGKYKGLIGLDKVLTSFSKSITQEEEKKQANKFLNMGKNIHDYFYPLRAQSANQNPISLKKVEMVTTLTVRTGTLSITAQRLVFIYNSYEQKQSHLAMITYKLGSEKGLIKQWPLQFIKEIFRRRYVNRKSALQIFFINGTSVFFNFPDGDSEEVSKKIVRLRHSKCPNLIYIKTLDPKKLYEGHNFFKKWTNFQISNFQYLMTINSLSGRSYKDLTQYHVFPWIVTSFAEKLDLSNNNSYRDLKKNIGCLGTQERMKIFQERYNNYDPQLSQGEKFHYGTHYSSPGIIYHYLVRISPFTEGAIQLQGGKFDFADRLFFSIQDSYRNCTTEYSDVRQLTPEFFILPEMFINSMKYDFGIMQTKKRVHNVQLPSWSNQNPYLYVTKLRRAVQSQYVNKNINYWIDLIYGFKQRGQEAIKSLNVFYYLTYQDSVNFESITDNKMKKAIQSQILNFGQTPSQLFVKPHQQKNDYTSLNFGNLITNIDLEAKVYRPSNKKQLAQFKIQVNPLHHQEDSVIKLKWIKDSKLICIRRNGNVINYKWYSQGMNRIPFQCAIQKQRKIDRISKLKYDPTQFYDPSVQLENFPIEVINVGQIILIGGINEGKLISIDSQTYNLIQVYKQHHETICVIKSDSKDNFVITGDVSGQVFLWRISNQAKLIPSHRFIDHTAQITSIFISYELRAFITSSYDGSVNMYNIITGKRMRTYLHPQKKPINNVILSSCPLAVVVMFCNKDRMIYSYSINGQLIQRVNEKDSAYLLVPTILKDMRTFEYVVYGNEKGQIYIRDLPFLDNPRKHIVAKDASVTNICISKDLKYLICSCSDGELSVITDPNTNNNKVN